MSNTKYLFFFL
ncbi:hypothetical protein SAMN05660841_01446 [Sphingobacterium nematocida]|uniref:Uncharacterized protein n=1 Tax=Sphingobacterium nematocida TaxID=1513896 RepID=A0A1T5CMM6_9SPHI|nr:hypothetical protein SAMN05660841_01446 [Sphingobacterium nematocida]